jgi:hypothetical protein
MVAERGRPIYRTKGSWRLIFKILFRRQATALLHRCHCEIVVSTTHEALRIRLSCRLTLQVMARVQIYRCVKVSEELTASSFRLVLNTMHVAMFPIRLLPLSSSDFKRNDFCCWNKFNSKFRRNFNTRRVTAYGITSQTTEFFSKSAGKTSNFSTASFLSEWQDHNVMLSGYQKSFFLILLLTLSSCELSRIWHQNAGYETLLATELQRVLKT